MIAVTQHTDVWLVRHTQTDWNKARRYQSRSERPLTPFGRRRAQAVASRLRRAPLDVIIASGQQRTGELASMLAGVHTSHPPVIQDRRWCEADHGLWEGLTYAEVARRYPSQASKRFADPWSSRVHEGESISDLWARVEAAWDEQLSEHMGKHILIITHATPIQLLLCALLGVPFARYWQLRIDLGGITNIDLYPSGAIVRLLNEVPPLVENLGS